MVSAEQIKAARALLRMEQDDLARRSGVSVSTIRRIEGAQGAGLVASATVETVVKTLQEAGVEFIYQGVSLRSPAAGDEALFGRLRAIAERAAARHPADGWLTDADLYGDDGLPK